MQSMRCLAVVLFALALAVPRPVWSSDEQPGSPESAATRRSTGERREGSQPAIPPTFGPIVTDTAIPLETGDFAIQPTFAFSILTDRFDQDWKRKPPGGNFYSFSMDWRLIYGPMENTELFVVIPYLHNWAGEVDQAGPNGERSADSGHLGDLNLTLKYRLLQETPVLPTTTALLAADFPTGRFKHPSPGALGTDVTGGGSYVFTAGINLSKFIRPFIVYGNLWYSMPTSYSDDEGRHYPEEFVTLNLAAEYPLAGKWVALLELTSSWGAGRLFGPKFDASRSALVSMVPGIEYLVADDFSLALGLSIDLAGKNADAVVAPLLSMTYSF